MDIEKAIKKFTSLEGVGEHIVAYYLSLQFSCTRTTKKNPVDVIKGISIKESLPYVEYEGALFEMYEDKKDEFNIHFTIYSSRDNITYVEAKVNRMINYYKDKLNDFYKNCNITVTDIDKEYVTIEDIIEDGEDFNKVLTHIKEEILFNRKVGE